MQSSSTYEQYSQRELLFMLGEELKKPLASIQLLASTGQTDNAATISAEARRALRTIDNVLMYQQLTNQQTALDLEPVHIGSALTAIAGDMTPASAAYGCEVEMYIQSGISTVDVNRQALCSGLESLWQAMLGLTNRPSPLSWHVYRQKDGIRVAVLNNSVDMSAVSFQKLYTKTGISKQPVQGIAGPATDLVTARGMFELIGGDLRKTKQRGREGLAVTLKASPQLSLV